MEFATKQVTTDEGIRTTRSTRLLALIMFATLLEYSLSMF